MGGFLVASVPAVTNVWGAVYPYVKEVYEGWRGYEEGRLL